MVFKWIDYTYEDDELVDSWIDEEAVSLTGLEDGWRAFYDYWANELKVGYWCKIVYFDNSPIAIIFFDYNPEIDSYHISEFVVRPEYRGKGYGTKIINELLDCSDDIFGQRIEKSDAVIFKNNIASQMAFAKAGFMLDGEDKWYRYKNEGEIGMEDKNFVKEENAIRLYDGDKVIAEVTFPKTEEGVYTINHTFVDDCLRGQGIAGKLVQMAVDDIQGRGGEVRATCSYAKKWIVNFVKDRINELLEAGSCCAELKEAGKNWLESVGTDNEEIATKNLIAELEEDVNLIDDTIGFFGSPMAAEFFGAEGAAQKLEDAKAAKAAGEKYCICPACQAGAAILKFKGELMDRFC